MPTTPLRLLAEDADDLAVISAACQDAIVRVGDIHFDRTARRVTLSVARFRWETATRRRGPFERIAAALSFDSVLSMKTRKLRTDSPDAFASVLAIAFEPGDTPPAGVVRLTLAGGAEIALAVECLDALLLDTGPSWPTPSRPDHDDA